MASRVEEWMPVAFGNSDSGFRARAGPLCEGCRSTVARIIQHP